MRRRSRLAALALFAALAAAGCGGDDDPAADREATPPSGAVIRIGTKNFPEQFVLGELYRQALSAKGFRVELKSNIGSTEITHQALTTGGIDMYPEYVGVLLSEVAKRRDRPTDPAAAYRAAKVFEERARYTLLEQTPFSNQNALAVTVPVARRHRLRTIADLQRLPGRVKIGAPPEFRTRFEGIIGLRSVYGLRGLEAVPFAIGDQYGALDEGTVRAAAVFTTDGALAGGDYVQLEDPRGVFATQRLAPIVSKAAVRAHGARLVSTLDSVSRTLTTSAMRRMNREMAGGAAPAAVARRFLAAQKG